MLTRLGIKMKVETMTRSVFFKRASSGGPNNTPKFSFILVGWGAGTGEASSPLKSLLATYDKTKGMGASNRGRYSNPEVDKLIAAGTRDGRRHQAAGAAREGDRGCDQGPGHHPAALPGQHLGVRGRASSTTPAPTSVRSRWKYPPRNRRIEKRTQSGAGPPSM